MKKLLLAIIGTITLVGNSQAQSFGLDYLGGAKYCDVILSSHPVGAPVGFFADTFGDFSGCLQRIIRSGKANIARGHLAWADNHVFAKRDFDRIAAKAEPYERIAKANPGFKLYLSGACEHNLNAADAKLLRAKVLAKCPSCAGYVNTPWRGALIDGSINEVHGKAQPPKIGEFFYSYDGESAVDSDVEATKRRMAKAGIFFLWEPRFNGRWETNDPTPRPNRKGWPDKKLIESVRRLAFGKGQVGRLPKNWIFKSHSENKGNGDSRAEKPVAIIDNKTNEISLVATNGKEIAKARYYGPFENKHRYYFPSWGYELADKARAVSGSSLAYLRVKGKNYGPINTAFREGGFR